MKYILGILVLTSVSCSKHVMDMEGIAEDVLSKKKGVEIKIEPIEETK